MKTAFTNGPVFLGDGRILDKATVIVEGDRIVEITEEKTSLGEDITKIDLAGGMLLPGLIDSHVHLNVDGSPDPVTKFMNLSIPANTLLAVDQARQTIMAGITTVRDMGGAHGVDLAIRDAVKAGQIDGPRILASGRVICMTGGHGWQLGGREADGPDEVRKAAREQIKAGADVVKLMATGGVMTPGVEPGSAQFTEEELRAGVEEAHKTGRRTATHAQGTQGILNALRAGIDTVEHGFYLTDQLVEMMVKQGTSFVPTLSAVFHILRGGREGGVPEFVMVKAEKVFEDHRKSTLLAKAAGVRIAMGTDSGTPFNIHGNNAWELELMVELGFSPVEALCSATGVAAQVLGLEDSLGTVEKGKLADLIVVDGDPLADIGILKAGKAVRLVMQGGRIIRQ